MISNSKNQKKNVVSVCQKKLCIGCSFCASICPVNCIKIKYDSKLGIYQPVVDQDKCTDCGLCEKICPGIDSSFLKNSFQNQDSKIKTDSIIGNYLQILTSYSQKKEVQQKGSAGGSLTQLLLYLLENKLINGAIVTTMDKKNPLKAKVIIAKTKAQILSAQQSKYCPNPIGKILKKIDQEQGSFAFVGLPCQAKALRQIQATNKNYENKIKYVFSLFCAHSPNQLATEYILNYHQIKTESVTKLEYRCGLDHLGYLGVKTTDGKLKKIPHNSFEYWGYIFSKFFIPTRCYLCGDKTGALADISFGDNWDESMKHPHGSTVMVVRHMKLLNLLKKMKSENNIKFQEINIQTLKLNHNFKTKANIEAKKWLWQFFGQTLPRYNNLEIKTGVKEIINNLSNYFMFVFSISKKPFWLITFWAKLFYFCQNIIQKIKHYFFILKSLVLAFLKYTKAFILLFKPVKAKKIIKKKKYKIIMIGGYGTKDIGDEAMPHSDIINFEKKLKNNVEIVMFSSNPKNTQVFHGKKSIMDFEKISIVHVKNYYYYFANFKALAHCLALLVASFGLKFNLHLQIWPKGKQALLELNSADLLFNVGGGNLNSLIPQEFYKKCFTYLVAKILNKPIVLSGQTIGPITGFWDKLVAKNCINKVDLITFRDKNISYNRCQQLGITKPKMKDTADDAMTLPNLNKIESKKLLISEVGKSWLNPDKKLIGINLKGSLASLRNMGSYFQVSDLTKILAKTADSLITKYNAQVVFIATDFLPGNDDRILHEEIYAQMKNISQAKILQEEYNDISLKSLIGLCDFALGARYHFCVFAASTHTPFLGAASGLYQMTKLKGLSKLCDLPQCYFKTDLAQASSNKLTKQCSKILENLTQVKKQLKYIEPKLSQKSLESIDHAIKLIKK